MHWRDGSMTTPFTPMWPLCRRLEPDPDKQTAQ
jgi:hypothetical protein